MFGTKTDTSKMKDLKTRLDACSIIFDSFFGMKASIKLYPDPRREKLIRDFSYPFRPESLFGYFSNSTEHWLPFIKAEKDRLSSSVVDRSEQIELKEGFLQDRPIRVVHCIDYIENQSMQRIKNEGLSGSQVRHTIKKLAKFLEISFQVKSGNLYFERDATKFTTLIECSLLILIFKAAILREYRDSEFLDLIEGSDRQFWVKREHNFLCSDWFQEVAEATKKINTNQTKSMQNIYKSLDKISGTDIMYS